ncbi:hypothetical protein [Streptomyces broussonetiae]|uniref:Uncharacterized protein n=1 Tax=Streptomyces broussonetiae TaxID=2686304 RepID=A0A6I6MYF6_9ACTN|nr:hypothetical protein [Streptomyces broussonetiae]QHA05878.1 hypothetical protein GQF42_23635 [Streptomyces broussonetiae]
MISPVPPGSRHGADHSVLTDYISTETYFQHNPEAADGRIVEHRDVIVPVPAKLPCGNGLF